jgi:hypothetical protein
MSKSISYYTTLGYDKVYPFYMVSSNGTDYTHFTDIGATQIARIVSEGVKEAGLDIAKYLIGTIVSTPTNTPTLKPTNTPTQKPTGTPTARPTATPTPKAANTPARVSEDINGDNVVNMSDVILIARSFNELVNESNLRCDVNMDGAINMSDVIKVALKFNMVITA